MNYPIHQESGIQKPSHLIDLILVHQGSTLANVRLMYVWCICREGGDKTGGAAFNFVRTFDLITNLTKYILHFYKWNNILVLFPQLFVSVSGKIKA